MNQSRHNERCVRWPRRDDTDLWRALICGLRRNSATKYARAICQIRRRKSARSSPRQAGKAIKQSRIAGWILDPPMPSRTLAGPRSERPAARSPVHVRQNMVPASPETKRLSAHTKPRNRQFRHARPEVIAMPVSIIWEEAKFWNSFEILKFKALRAASGTIAYSVRTACTVPSSSDASSLKPSFAAILSASRDSRTG